jgi:hypothetical protein
LLCKAFSDERFENPAWRGFLFLDYPTSSMPLKKVISAKTPGMVFCR